MTDYKSFMIKINERTLKYNYKNLIIINRYESSKCSPLLAI